MQSLALPATLQRRSSVAGRGDPEAMMRTTCGAWCAGQKGVRCPLPEILPKVQAAVYLWTSALFPCVQTKT